MVASQPGGGSRPAQTASVTVGPRLGAELAAKVVFVVAQHPEARLLSHGERAQVRPAQQDCYLEPGPPEFARREKQHAVWHNDHGVMNRQGSAVRPRAESHIFGWESLVCA